ncbi:16S rRNA-processing protein RimM [Ligilactobacillus apodemi DSM 16634 = JCM 16172]|uniref:Ribosome maturation factor RimM n=2 Tax=Ligilactobacillus TaxID=2767887 RepID=A0A0R1TQL1_9LACO|nr:16S rRNA-processing protein RimM [Ligilactobacillus apodemi DSM 16634 = JCM 16172]
MAANNMEFYQVGKIVNTHGIRGEVRVVATTDFPEERFKAGNKLYAFKPNATEGIELTVKKSRKHKQFIMLTFEGMENINLVEPLKGDDLKVSAEQQKELEEGSYYYHQIIGLEAVTTTGEELGKITEILSPGANDVWVVKRKNKKDLLLPVIDDVIKEVDLAAGKVEVELLDGLDD